MTNDEQIISLLGEISQSLKMLIKKESAEEKQPRFIGKTQAKKILNCCDRTLANYSKQYSGLKMRGVRNMYNADKVREIAARKANV